MNAIDIDAYNRKHGFTERRRAENFIAGCLLGVERMGQFYGETAYGRDECFVYFAKCRDAVKIGMTRGHPEKRLRELQIGCPEKIELFGFVIANRGLEADLHKVLAQDNIHGEWFRWSEFCQQVVNGCLDEIVI